MLGWTPLLYGEERPARERAFLELEADTTTPVVGQVVTLRVRFGLETPWFEEHAVQLYRQAMDIPVQLRVPWRSELRASCQMPIPTVMKNRPLHRRRQRIMLCANHPTTKSLRRTTITLPRLQTIRMTKINGSYKIRKKKRLRV